VAMVELYQIRIRYLCLLFHLVGGDLHVSVEKGRESSGRCFHRAVNLVQSICVTCLMSEDSDQFKRSMATTSTLGRWSLGTRAQRLLDCHEQCQVGSSSGAATATHRWLALAVVMVIK
jgi:hypothetical protein